MDQIKLRTMGGDILQSVCQDKGKWIVRHMVIINARDLIKAGTEIAHRCAASTTKQIEQSRQEIQYPPRGTPRRWSCHCRRVYFLNSGPLFAM